ncbi:MAG: DUF1223 domain-containing protein [Verrucomicrobiota bacterium]
MKFLKKAFVRWLSNGRGGYTGSLATLVWCGLLVSAPRLWSASPIFFQSTAAQTPLLELYVSEGCSSCPPAETWLSHLTADSKLWKDFVPVAFHVDYWDYLGWKDPFAAKAYSERQRVSAEQGRTRSVYTPGFVLNGKEWRGWFDDEKLPRGSGRIVGQVIARSTNGTQWTLRFDPSDPGASSLFDFHAALLGFNLKSDVKAGENRGRKLEHDFVVLALAEVAAAKGAASYEGVLTLKSALTVVPKRAAVAVWITPRNRLEPIQSLGGWLPGARE